MHVILDREQFQLGSLSHFLNQRCRRYRDLPQFPEIPPDPSMRNTTDVEEMNDDIQKIHETEDDESEEGDFYSDDEEESEKDESDEEKVWSCVSNGNELKQKGILKMDLLLQLIVKLQME